LQIAPIFDNQEKRNELWSDWVNHVNVLHVVQNSLAGWGHRRLRLIITREVILLLSPSESPPLEGTYFEYDGEGNTAFRERELQTTCKNSSDLIARLFRFLQSLKTRFPDASAKEMLTCIERFTGNATKNMTLAGAHTISDWWHIKVFIDEASCWLAEMGGLFENDSEVLVPQIHDMNNDTLYDFTGFDQTMDSRPATGKQRGDSVFDSPDPTLTHGHPESINHLSRSGSLAQRPITSISSLQTSKIRSKGKENEVHNDSGIGLGIEDDFGMDTKFHSFVETVNGSDPGDVVVC
jgi:hypothetical protein